MPSRRELSRLMREAGVDQAYHDAFKKSGANYQRCVTRRGDTIIINRACLDQEGDKLKDDYEGVWTY